jgi:hypothetical protein
MLAEGAVSGAAMGNIDGKVLAEAIAEIGINSPFAHSLILGEWRVLQKLYRQCIRDAEVAVPAQ